MHKGRVGRSLKLTACRLQTGYVAKGGERVDAFITRGDARSYCMVTVVELVLGILAVAALADDIGEEAGRMSYEGVVTTANPTYRL